MFLILRKLGRTWNRKFRLKIFKDDLEASCKDPVSFTAPRCTKLVPKSMDLLGASAVWQRMLPSGCGDGLALPAGLVFALLFVRSRDGPVSPG